jgi:hypothetical protein
MWWGEQTYDAGKRKRDAKEEGKAISRHVLRKTLARTLRGEE